MHFQIGYAYQLLKRYKLAIKTYQKSLKIDSYNAVVYYHLARCHALEGNIDIAKRLRQKAKTFQEYNDHIEEARAYINKYPDKPEGYMRLANLHTQRKEWQEAIWNYQFAISVDSKFLPAYQELADLYIELHDLDNASKVYQKSIHQFPQDIQLRVMLALLYKEQSRLDLAIEHLNIAEEVVKNLVNKNPVPKNLEQLSFVYYAKGLYNQSEELLSELMKQDPNNLDYIRQLKVVQSARAQQTWKK